MPIRVKVPGGSVTFPDGMSREDINASLQKRFGEPKGVRQELEVEEAVANPAKPTSQTLGFVEGATRPLGKVARAVGIDTGPMDRNIEAMREKNEPGVLGAFAGSMLNAIPLARGLQAARVPAALNSFLVGGAMGGLESDKTGSGLATDAVKGAFMGKAGDSAARVAGAVISPRWRGSVNRMLDEGVRLTPGQIVGGTAHTAEDVLSNVLGVGDVVRGAQRRAEGDAVNAATNRALRPSGRALAPGVEPGHEGVRVAQQELDNIYNSVIPQTTLNVGSPRLARAFVAPVARLHNMAQSLPGGFDRRFNELWQRDVVPRFAQNGRMSGREFKQLDEMLGKEYSNYRSGGPEHRDYANAVRQLQIEMRAALARSNPVHARAIRAADEGYANLTRVETAAAGAKGGKFTPGELRSATVAMDTTTRNRASAAGTARMRQFAEDADDTVGRTIGDGVGTRAGVNALLGAAMYGTGATSAALSPLGMTALGAVTAAYTRPGNAFMRAMLARRPQGAAEVRRGIQRVANTGIPAAAAAVISGKPHKPDVEEEE